MKNNKIPSIIICSNKEKIENLGEDSYSYSFCNGNIGYISVFDGCGGMGARKYPKADNKTGAYIASRLAAYVTDLYYNNQQFKFDGTDSERLKKKLEYSFQKIKDKIGNDGALKLGGDLFKTFPTTASIASINFSDDDRYVCEYIWAGDSRGYFLDSEGLCQVTKDDLHTEEDAFTNLRSDGRMSNVIHADGEFILNQRTMEFSSPVMIIVSTDGGFGYFGTPMDFEYIILRSLAEAVSAEDWEKKLENLIIPVSGDDFAVCIALLGLKDINECKRYFKERYIFIKNKYADKISEESTEKELEAMWQEYKIKYYRW